MGELQQEPFQLTFNGLLKVAFQGSRVTSEACLLLVRELDERLGLGGLIAKHLTDTRHGLNRQFSLADLVRQSVYIRLAGYEDLNDAERLAADPTFRLIGSPKIWDRGAVLNSTLHRFETELLTQEENLIGLMAVNRELLAQAAAMELRGTAAASAKHTLPMPPGSCSRWYTSRSKGRQCWTCINCGKILPLKAPSSICGKCQVRMLRRMADGDDLDA